MLAARRTVSRLVAPLAPVSVPHLHALRHRSFSSHPPGPVQRTIEAKLSAAFAPVAALTVQNESHMHSVPPGSETHFRVVLASPRFEEVKTRIARHRLVNTELRDELQSGVHALSLQLFTPAEWAALPEDDPALGPSPNCKGGFGK